MSFTFTIIAVLALSMIFTVIAMIKAIVNHAVGDDFSCRELVPGQLSLAALEFFYQTDAIARDLGFAYLTTYTQPFTPTINELRLYLHQDGLTSMTAAVFTAMGKVTRAHWFVNRLADGMIVETHNAPIYEAFAPPPWSDKRRYRFVRDPARLLALHRRRVEVQLKQGRTPEPLDPARVFDHVRESSERLMAYQVEKRQFTYDPPTRSFHPTPAQALRHLAAFYNPLEGKFSLAQLIGGPLVALAALVAGPLVFQPIIVGWLAAMLQADGHDLANFIIYAPWFFLAGLSISVIPREKSGMWALLVSLAGFLALPESIPEPGYLIGLAYCTAKGIETVILSARDHGAHPAAKAPAAKAGFASAFFIIAVPVIFILGLLKYH